MNRFEQAFEDEDAEESAAVAPAFSSASASASAPARGIPQTAVVAILRNSIRDLNNTISKLKSKKAILDEKLAEEASKWRIPRANPATAEHSKELDQQIRILNDLRTACMELSSELDSLQQTHSQNTAIRATALETLQRAYTSIEAAEGTVESLNYDFADEAARDSGERLNAAIKGAQDHIQATRDWIAKSHVLLAKTNFVQKAELTKAAETLVEKEALQREEREDAMATIRGARAHNLTSSSRERAKLEKVFGSSASSAAASASAASASAASSLRKSHLSSQQQQQYQQQYQQRF